MSALTNYDDAVKTIKLAILRSQYSAVRSVNENQLSLYYWIGRYISENSRFSSWGNKAIDTISHRLESEMPGLRGFSARNLRNMRRFYEEWSALYSPMTIASKSEPDNLAVVTAKSDTDIPASDLRQLSLPNSREFPVEAFLSIGFTQHVFILSKVKTLEERLFYIKLCAAEHYTVDLLKDSIARNDFHHQGKLVNNFLTTISSSAQALRAINTFKDEYLLDYMNVEELDIRDQADIDEKVIENAIVHNIKNFILTFGKNFAFIKNQFHLDAFGEEQYIDLLFFCRELNCLVAVELKKGKFKTSYLGQLSGYLSVLDKYERKPHENPSIGIILCKDMNKAFVDFVIRDYSKPMGVATYKTSKDMSSDLIRALPDIADLQRLLDTSSNEDLMGI